MPQFDPSTAKPVAAPRRFDPTTIPELGQLSDPSQVAARPEDVAEKKRMIEDRSAQRKYREQFQLQNADRGVPMDVDAELPASLRARASFEPDLKMRADLISKQPDVLSARVSKDGKNIIARINDESGNPKDVLLNPLNTRMTIGDVAGAAKPIVSGAAAGALGVATGGASLPLTALAMGGGAALNEAGLTTGSRILAGQDVKPGDVATRAAGEGALNAALPAAAGGGKALVGAVVNRGADPVKAAATREAAERLGLPLMPSMARDSAALAGAERRTLAGKGSFDKEQSGALAATKDRQLGLSGKAGVLSESDTAGRVQPLAAKEFEAAESGVRSAYTNAEKAAMSEIQDALDRGITPSRATTSDVGNFIREKVAGRGADSKASILRAEDAKLFGEVNRLANAEGVAVAPTAVQKLAAELSTDEKKALLELTPGIGKIPRISEVLSEGRPLSLSDARELRRTAFDLANSPSAPGQAGTTKEQLMRLYRALDEDMKTAIAAGSPDLKAANQAAEAFHKANIQPLQQSDVAKLFLTTDEAGRIGGDEIVRRLFTGKGNLDALRAYRDVLGKDSPEWKLLVRQGVQTAMDEAGARTGKVDAGALLRRFQSFQGTELADEIIGPSAKQVANDATLMARAQGVKIPVDELEDALAATPGNASKLLREAIDREVQFDRTYNTQFQKALRDGTLGPRTIGTPDDFVERIVFKSNASEPELRQAMAQIASKDPAAAEGIRQNTLLKVLRDSRASLEPGELSTEAMDVGKLLAFANGKEGAQARVVLGREGAQFLDDLATYAAANEKRLAQPGQIRGGEQDIGRATAAAIGHKISIARLAADAALAVPRYALGTAINVSPAVRNYLSTGTLPKIGAKTRAAVLAAPEVISEGNKVLSEQP